MFFIFSFDLLAWVIMIGSLLFLLIVFPGVTLLLTVLCVWVLVLAIRGRGNVDE